ncbi:MAG TPA: cellulose binding domain-containing protein [Actinomycetes bacterium]
MPGTITNGTGATVNGWTVAFALASGQTLGTFWDATLNVGAGNRVTAVARAPGPCPREARGVMLSAPWQPLRSPAPRRA